ncbi:hypothetical protein C2G38_2216878 [Gigaspora rosea]|uniref:Uncharacterized protein n=1 Tax=Gigaspora rosea TaxID=44941 RepID=A0A397UCN0_9GLOM|nr:hypothetical protein C2G38_2216878 [Gigaspora rosea]
MSSSHSKKIADKRKFFGSLVARTYVPSDSPQRTEVQSPVNTPELRLLLQILQLLNELSDKIDRIERKVFEMDDRISEGLDTSQETAFIKHSVKEIAKSLIESNIYPTKTELRQATAEYLEDNEPDFWAGIKSKNWNT